MSYNGWTNYETWSVALWVDNDEPTYRFKLRALRHLDPDEVTADVAESIARDLFPSGRTPDGADLDAVNWDEIAGGWAEEVAA